MARIKRGTTALKRRKNVLALTKGFRWRRKSNERLARQAILKAGTYAHRDRRAKKRTMRALWIKRLSNALAVHEIRYSQFVHMMKTKEVAVDRKILAQIAVEDAPLFDAVVAQIKA